MADISAVGQLSDVRGEVEYNRRRHRQVELQEAKLSSGVLGQTRHRLVEK